MECNPRFCPGLSSHEQGATHVSVQLSFWGPQSDSCQAKFSGCKMRQKRRLSLSLGKKGWITIFFSFSIRFWKGRENVKFTFSPPGNRQRSGRADFGKNCYPLQASASFPRMPSACSRVSGGVPAGLTLATRNCRGGKIIFSLPFVVSVWLRALFLQGTS